MTDKKVCLITGPTSGIGLATALELANRNYYLILLGRNPEKLEKAKSQISAQTGNNKIDIVLSDLSMMASTHKAALQILDKYERIEVLINNAGLIAGPRTETSEGFELTFATNHLSHFLLTNKLKPLLSKSGAARVVHVASDSHKWNRLDPSDFQMKGNYSPLAAYGNSKLMNILFSNELARRWKADGITSNSLHPGVVNTNFGKSSTSLMRALVFVFGRLAIAPEKGAETSVFLADSDKVNGVTGGYFSRCKEVQPAALALNDEIAARLWEYSDGLLKLYQ